MITYILAVLFLGIFVGLIAGMFGLGGGGIIVPALLLLLPLIGVPTSQVMFIAMGSAFAAMIVSTAATAYHHYRQNNIDLRRLKLFLPFLLITALLTSHLVTSINPNFLKLFFSLFLIYSGSKMLISSQKPISDLPQTVTYFKTRNFLTAIGIGLIATLGGISGAGLIVPFFNKSGTPIKKSIGTAALCGVFLTIFAAIGFIMSGVNQTDLPKYSLGFIHLRTVILISLLSVPMSKVGVKIMLKLPDNKLKQYFAIFLIILSVYMTTTTLIAFLN